MARTGSPHWYGRDCTYSTPAPRNGERSAPKLKLSARRLTASTNCRVSSGSQVSRNPSITGPPDCRQRLTGFDRRAVDSGRRVPGHGSFAKIVEDVVQHPRAGLAIRERFVVETHAMEQYILGQGKEIFGNHII